MQIYRSNDTLIELTPKSVSKLTAIELLLTSGESLADVISFGDNYNDIEMLQHTGLGVAVGNAREEVKAVSNHTTLKNTEDGVAHFIKEHLVI
jgi:hydroxymethylpyrimidine pyrophosphatase-like HAD family hydrolase